MKNLGDKIASVAQPIAKVSDAVLGTELSGCSGCKKMRDDLNSGISLAAAFYDRFWKPKQDEEK